VDGRVQPEGVVIPLRDIDQGGVVTVGRLPSGNERMLDMKGIRSLLGRPWSKASKYKSKIL
jgi:hypothetical protein